MKKQQGFTLIELMIAVAIIGILAAVAIPQYQKYVARAQVSEAVTLLSGLKSPVIEYYSVNGDFPVLSSTNAEVPAITTGKFVEKVEGTGGDAGTYVATFKGSDVSADLFNKELNMVFSSNGSIACQSPNANGVPEELLPSTCEKL